MTGLRSFASLIDSTSKRVLDLLKLRESIVERITVIKLGVNDRGSNLQAVGEYFHDIGSQQV